MRLYGEEKTDEEIIQFVKSYYAKFTANKHDRYHTIMKFMPSGKHVLDYGCGWGCYSMAITDKGNKVTAIDISQNEIDICNLVWGKRDNLEFQRADPSVFPNSAFDYVLSNQVIEHVHNPGMYLSEINRILKEDGKLVIALPNFMNCNYFLSMLCKNLGEQLKTHSRTMREKYNKAHNHIMCWDPWHFTTLCASVGFQLEHYAPMEGMPFPQRPYFPSYLHLNWPRLRNLSYTMVFVFNKIKKVAILPND